MKLKYLLLASFLTGLLSFAALAQRTNGPQVLTAKQSTLAIKYRDNDGTSVDMVGSAVYPEASGKADVKRKDGRTKIKLDLDQLKNPQSLGAYYTTYVLWAIAPEGQADNLAELPVKNGHIDTEVTTNFQTFGLIVTAEPYGAVKLPSPVIVSENALRRKTEGGIETSQIEYRAYSGSVYAVSGSNGPAINADFTTPLSVLGARRSVEIARRAGAPEYAQAEFHDAEVKLAALEQTWSVRHMKEADYNGTAHDVERLAENARELAITHMIQAGLQSEREAAQDQIASAKSDADRSREEAERARLETERARSEADRASSLAATYKQRMSEAQAEVQAAKDRLAQAQTDADKAKANEELARIEANQSKLEAEQAKADRDAAQQNLYASLSAILETRREARGLIVNLSDILFDTGKATLKPGAREKLSKLAGILVAYPGVYRIEVDGYTDSVGGDDYNLKLSEARAQSVTDYLSQSGIKQEKILASHGFGKMRPVATNETAEGRQMNRRVEIVISDSDNQIKATNPQ